MARGHDPEMERLVEIHSVWACSERAEHQGNPYPIRVQGGETDGQHVIDALNLGYRFGMDYYYGRLMREDGQMAWSSPVWVES